MARKLPQKDIKVSGTGIAEIIITPENKIDQKQDHIVKALCMLQLMCLNRQKGDEQKHDELIKIVKNACAAADELYNGVHDGGDFNLY